MRFEENGKVVVFDNLVDFDRLIDEVESEDGKVAIKSDTASDVPAESAVAPNAAASFEDRTLEDAHARGKAFGERFKKAFQK